MLGSFTVANNVRCTLHTAINSVAANLVVDAATGMFNDFPDPTGDDASAGLGIATIIDSLTQPTKVEIVTYGKVLDNGDGTLTLKGITRACEGTTAQSFGAGAIVMQAMTAAQMLHALLEINQVSNLFTVKSALKVNGAATFDGNATVTGNAILADKVSLQGVASITAPSGNIHNWNPDIGSVSVLRLTTTSSGVGQIGGLVGGSSGRVVTIMNLSGVTYGLLDEDAASVAGNRFALGGDVTLAPNKSVTLWYDAVSSRWRILCGNL